MNEPKKEKVTKALECCASEFDCTDCPYRSIHDVYDTCVRNLMLDILSILKDEQPNAEDK